MPDPTFLDTLGTLFGVLFNPSINFGLVAPFGIVAVLVVAAGKAESARRFFGLIGFGLLMFAVGAYGMAVDGANLYMVFPTIVMWVSAGWLVFASCMPRNKSQRLVITFLASLALMTAAAYAVVASPTDFAVNFYILTYWVTVVVALSMVALKILKFTKEVWDAAKERRKTKRAAKKAANETTSQQAAASANDQSAPTVAQPAPQATTQQQPEDDMWFDSVTQMWWRRSTREYWNPVTQTWMSPAPPVQASAPSSPTPTPAPSTGQQPAVPPTSPGPAQQPSPAQLAGQQPPWKQGQPSSQYPHAATRPAGPPVPRESSS